MAKATAKRPKTARVKKKRRRTPPFLEGGGELGRLMREKDWSRTSLGDPASWPQSLKVALRIILTSQQPFWIGWGKDLTYFYNDPYKAIIGGKHPRALGRPTREVWSEIWDIISPMLSKVMAGEGTYVESQLLIMERHGYREETYYTFSYSPVPQKDSKAGGIICANTDDTRRVIGERQLALLKELASQTANVRSWEEACEKGADALLTNRRDLTFALIYVADPQTGRVALAQQRGLPKGHPAAHDPACAVAPGPWPIEKALGSRDLVILEELPDSVREGLPGGAWDEPPQKAALIPLPASGTGGRAGVLVVGLNPYRLLDEGYRNFLSLVGGHISAGVANGQAYEQERRRAEALAEIDRAKTQFFSNVSHEFRTPLTLMLGPVESILSGRDLPSDLRNQLESVHRNSLRLLKLVNSLLDFSRIEAGRMEANFEPTNLFEFTGEVAGVFRSAVEKAGLAFVVRCAPLAGPVPVDRDMWEKILLNLLSNALKFTHEGGIEVELRPAGEWVELAVSDTGVGIPPEELPKMFDRFHRIQDARGRTHEGTGIGLALVQELVKLHGGTIRVESVLNAGSRFTVSIPKRRDQPDSRRARNGVRRLPRGTQFADALTSEASRWQTEGGEATDFPAIPPPLEGGAKPRVLWADDNADMRDYVSRILGEQFEVQAVGDGMEALEAAQAQPPDLVLSDVMMPKLDGYGLLKALRLNPALSAVPVILLSARAGEEERIEGVGSGADDYITKPFTRRELLARISSHLKMARMRREAEEELKRARDDALAANRAKDEFLATLSHELRTPLNPVLLISSEASADPTLSEEVKADFKAIADNVSLQARLIDDLLDFNRIVRGKFTIERRRLDLHDIIREATAAVREEIKARRHDLAFSFAADRYVVVGDPVRLRQVLWNVIKNAVKFTRTGGSIRIVTSTVGDRVEVAVCDTGIGIRPSDLTRIFEPFVQGGARGGEDRSPYGGLGLGLAIARMLVEQHGGTIRAASEGPGHGAAIIIRLPLATADESAEFPPGEWRGAFRPPSAVARRILFVEDHEPTRVSLARLLARRGYAVESADSLRSALEAADGKSFDVLVSDLGLPDGDGCMLLRELRGRQPSILGVAISGYGMDADLARSSEAGFSSHLTKPISIDALDRALKKIWS